MIYTDNSFTLQERRDSQEAFALWQAEVSETVDAYTLRKRKAELYALVRRIIKNDLEPHQQEFVRLHWYEGKSLVEIADILGVNKSYVYRVDKKINDIIYDKLKYAIEYRFGKNFSDTAPLIIKSNPSACCPIEGKDIAHRLRNLRLRQCLDAKDIEAATGIKAHRLDFIENQGEQITAYELSRLTKLFGTTSDYIIFGRSDSNGGRSDAVC